MIAGEKIETQMMNVRFLDLQKINHRYEPEISEALDRVVRSGWYLQGAENERFEKAYADYIGQSHCVGCGNGLDALTLIYRAYIEMGVMKPGDEVIVPANTYIASILAITENGLTPVLAEPDPATLELDDSRLEQLITSRTRSILLVHLYGRCAYTERIGSLCSQYGLKLVEDNAQAHGCRWTDGRRTGSLGDAAGHSFYPGKNLGALGDAGAVTTDDTQLALTVRALANYGSQRKYVFQYAGRNSRLDELQAAVLSVKLKYLDADNEVRRRLARIYISGIRHAEVELPATLPHDDMNVYHLFPIFCRRRDQLQQYLNSQGVQTLIHYPIPPHKQACYKSWNQMSLPVTERLHEQELSLPISQVMTDEEVCQVVHIVNAFE